MGEKEEVAKLFEEFKERFGFKHYEGIVKHFNTLYRKIEDLQTSRDMWKNKCMELKG